MSYNQESARGGARDEYYSGHRYDDSDDEDYRQAEKHAATHAEGSGDSSLFSTALGLLSGKKQSLKEEDLDEDDAVNQHRKFYGGESHESQATEGNLGAAAAMQALKLFNSSSGGGSSSKSEFLGLAMAQASKLFDEQSAQGKTDSSASKQGAVQQAAQMALKMYLKSDNSGSGGSKPSGLMGLASKFL
ncbi:beta-flanking protein [Diplodia corticola]|uniref:Beta-flanking protein n=1 Tax=Diplodia corticola TaxID=236234 RepID=A0A1J9RZR5_9PEZI|nr:beta-flanking protein [Diplodia corticola]OJD32941.1 beta-flanking protein [Diplodia corticola]